jgi:hypothetical protein
VGVERGQDRVVIVRDGGPRNPVGAPGAMSGEKKSIDARQGWTLSVRDGVGTHSPPWGPE